MRNSPAPKATAASGLDLRLAPLEAHALAGPLIHPRASDPVGGHWGRTRSFYLPHSRIATPLTAGILSADNQFMIRPIPLCDVQPWLQAMAAAHHAETSHPGTPLAISWDLLADMDVSGSLLTMVAMDADVVVGYSLHILSPHPLYGEVWATPIALYVRPEFRHLGYGRKLVEQAERECQRRGVSVVCQVAPAGAAPFTCMLSGLGYWRTETLWSKRL